MAAADATAHHALSVTMNPAAHHLSVTDTITWPGLAGQAPGTFLLNARLRITKAEPAVEEVPGAIVYNLDDIREKTNEALERRVASIPQVQSIIQEAICDFEDWSKEMIVSPTIQKLKNTLEQIRREELARYLKNAKPEEAEKLEEMSRSIKKKILKYPVLHLKAACRRGDAESLTEILNDLFNLENQPEKTAK